MTDLQLYRQLNTMGEQAKFEWERNGCPPDFSIKKEWNGITLEYQSDGNDFFVKYGHTHALFLNSPAHDIIFKCLSNNVVDDVSAWVRLARINANITNLCEELKNAVWDMTHYKSEIVLMPQKINMFLSACEEFLEKGTYTLDFIAKEVKPLDFCFC